MTAADRPIAAGPRFPVQLVGAGPGDPDLLTVAAARAIAAAQVLLVDDLVDERVMALASPQARVFRVGKRGGCPSTPQRFIEKLMIREALAGQRVVRLKGGDPLLFGRAGEEVDALRAAGLQVQVINGISSAFAAAASLSMSLTHREHSQGVVFVTGHPKPQGGDPDWALLARSGFTLAIYMGLARIGPIRQALLDAGLPADLPAAAVRSAGAAGQRQLVSSLGAIADDLAHAGFTSPVMIFIGKVAATASIDCQPDTIGRDTIDRGPGDVGSAVPGTPRRAVAG